MEEKERERGFKVIRFDEPALQFKHPAALQECSNRSAPMTTRASQQSGFEFPQQQEKKKTQQLLLNTIEEASKSKGDSEWAAGVSLCAKNVFLAPANTPKNDAAAYNFSLARTYLQLMTKGQLHLAESALPRAQPADALHFSQSDLLSPELLGAFHSVLGLLPKPLKTHLTAKLTHLVLAARSPQLVEHLLPTFKEALKFCACFEQLASFEPRSLRASAAGSSQKPDGPMSALYRNTSSQVAPGHAGGREGESVYPRGTRSGPAERRGSLASAGPLAGPRTLGGWREEGAQPRRRSLQV